MIECDWNTAPSWASFFVELEGNRSFWSSQEIKEMEWVPLLTNEELPNVEDSPAFYALSVVQCIPPSRMENIDPFQGEWKAYNIRSRRKACSWDSEANPYF